MTHVLAVSLLFSSIFRGLGGLFTVFFQGFGANAIFAFLILLCFPAFRAPGPKLCPERPGVWRLRTEKTIKIGNFENC